MQSLPQRETVDLMRVRCAGADPLTVKLRLSNLFQGLDLRPAALPAGAILRIRHFADPLPGRIRVSGYAMFPPEEWRRAAQAAIDRMAGLAVRPRHNAVPADAPAIVFQDEPELLACMAATVIRGSTDTAWWWSDVPPARFEPAAEVVRRLHQSPRLIPAFADYLSASGEFVPWLGSIEPERLRVLARAAAEAFALPSTWWEIAERVPASFPLDWEAPSPFSAAEPWASIAPEACAPGLQPGARYFAGMVLTLQRSPARVRSVEFASAVECWIEQLERPSREPPGSTPPPPEPAHPPEPSLPAPLSAAEPQPVPAEPAASPPVAEPAALQHRPAAPLRIRNVLVPVRTALGGLFYLVNYGIYAGFYGDFTQPLHPCLPLPVWDFIELLGRALGPEPAPEFSADDPVWQLLAELSGREEDEPAGALFLPPEGLDVWLAETACGARERLCLALELEDPTKLFPLLIARPARVYAGAANIDVVFPLDDLPLAIRYAGLDRDPGWVPAAGRTIAFHFE